MWTNLLPTLLLLQIIAVQALPSLTKTPRFFNIPFIELRGFNQDGCQTQQNISTSILRVTSCSPIASSNTGITNVVVVANDQLPSTCILTLYADSNCGGTSSANIGPIFPSSNPSACVGPIRDSAGNLFQAKSAILNC